MPSSDHNRLLTFPPMIDSEACRFVLAHYAVPYQEEPHLFGWASLLSLWRGLTLRVPLLYGGPVCAAGPHQLVDRFDKICDPTRKLIPHDPALAQQVSADWDSFNGNLGTAVAVFAYYQLLPLRPLMTELMGRGLPPSEKAYLKRSYSTFAGLFKLLLQLNPQHAKDSLTLVRSSFDAVDKRVGDGRPYLAGDRFTLADIALAASAAPLLLPPGFTAPLPAFEQMPPEMAAAITELRQHETARFVEGIYRRHGPGLPSKAAANLRVDFPVPPRTATPILYEQAPNPVDTAGIATPRGNDGLFGALIKSQGFLSFGSKLAWWLTSVTGEPLRIGSSVIVVSHAHVNDVLARDLDFLIAPVNAARIEAVNGPFVLGMDRGVVLAKEREALYSALRKVDFNPLKEQVRKLARQAIATAPESGLDVVGGYARAIAARTARSLFGLTGQDDVLFQDVVRAIFAHTFLNIGNDKTIEARALKAAALMRGWFDAEIGKRRAGGVLGDDMMGWLLKDGLLDDDGVRRTLGGMLVGSIDTTATAAAKIIAVLGGDKDLRERVSADRKDPSALWMWCLEALRRWPHNPLILRQAATDTSIGDTDVKKGDTIVALTQAAMQDPDVFPEPALSKPDRPQSSYLHFGGGLHPCAGRAVNDFQISILVGELLERGIAGVGRVVWAGPFPDELVVSFARTRA